MTEVIAELSSEIYVPPRRARLPKGRIILTATALVLAGAACGDDSGEAPAAPSTTAAAADSGAGFCDHLQPGEGEQPPEKLDNGNVMFVYTDLDDSVKWTINVYDGPGTAGDDRVSPGQYCDGEQGMAECKVSNGREVPYDEDYDPKTPDSVKTGWLLLANGEDDWASEMFIKDRDTVMGMLEECPASLK